MIKFLFQNIQNIRANSKSLTKLTRGHMFIEAAWLKLEDDNFNIWDKYS